MSIKKLYVDMDGTFWDTIGAICEMYDEDFSCYPDYVRVHPHEIETYNFEELALATPELISFYFNQARFFRKAECMPKAYSVLKTLLMDDYEITFVSMGDKPNLLGKRNEIDFMNNLLGTDKKFGFIPVDMNNYKDKSHIDMSDGILIDDMASILTTSNAADKICFGDKYSWNKDWKGKRCYNWMEVSAYLKEREE